MRPNRFPLAACAVLTATLSSSCGPPARLTGGRDVGQGAVGGRAEAAIDVQLVIAVNVSWQLDLNELSLQREQLRTALSSPAVLDAVRSRPQGVSLTIFEWAGVGVHDQLVPWTVIPDAAGALARLELRDYKSARGVSYSSAVAKALDSFDSTAGQATRRVLLILSSVEGDPGDVQEARTRLRARKVDLAVLPLMVRAPWGARGLDKFFSSHLVDDLSLIEPVTDIFQTEEAIRRLLVRIIAP